MSHQLDISNSIATNFQRNHCLRKIYNFVPHDILRHQLCFLICTYNNMFCYGKKGLHLIRLFNNVQAFFYCSFKSFSFFLTLMSFQHPPPPRIQACWSRYWISIPRYSRIRPNGNRCVEVNKPINRQTDNYQWELVLLQLVRFKSLTV